MEMNVFATKLRKAMAEVLGEDYRVELSEVTKNNGVLLQGLMILAKGQNVSPTIYIKPFWEAYEGGVPLSEIVGRMLQIYNEDMPTENVDMSFFRNFAEVKERICYRLIHAGQNQKLLEKIPHIPFLDLAICFFYAYDGLVLGKGTIMIYHTHVTMWETSTEELMKLAEENTPRLYPWECNSMDKVIRELVHEQELLTGECLLEEEEQQRFLTDMPMEIVSNRQRIFGAACILYPGLLKQLADELHSDFYILPSSIHEVILLVDNHRENPIVLKQMIAEVNETQVEPEEILSNSLYHYNCDTNMLSQI